MIGYFYHQLFQKHLEGYGHVEQPDRVAAIRTRIENSPLANSLTFIEAQPAQTEWLELVHDPAYINGILSLEIKDAVILDWDVHHGNGTEKMFADDNRILYISLHQYPHYPGTGAAEMRGSGRGEGFTLNLPMGPNAGDREYLLAFDDKIIPGLDTFAPEFILISAGFDAHDDDPLSDTGLTTDAYYRMTARLADCARRHCRGRILSLLEGGYDLKALAESVEAHIKALVETEK